MAKVQFSKLGLKKPDIKTQTINFNGQDIEVKNYLPTEEKFNMVADAINASMDQNKFYNSGKLNVEFYIRAIEHYTNISFTDKQLADRPGLFDLIATSGILPSIMEAIGDDINYAYTLMMDVVDQIYKYNNSVAGIIDIVSQNYDRLNFDAETIKENLSNPEQYGFLKEVMTKLG